MTATTAATSALATALQFTVPFLIDDFRQLSEEMRTYNFAAEREQMLEAITVNGDILQYGVGRGASKAERAEAAASFGQLARAIAYAAFITGGVPFADRTWCATHSPAGRRAQWPCSGCGEEAG